jgi:hypothetical protein
MGKEGTHGSGGEGQQRGESGECESELHRRLEQNMFGETGCKTSVQGTVENEKRLPQLLAAPVIHLPPRQGAGGCSSLIHRVSEMRTRGTRTIVLDMTRWLDFDMKRCLHPWPSNISIVNRRVSFWAYTDPLCRCDLTDLEDPASPLTEKTPFAAHQA